LEVTQPNGEKRYNYPVKYIDNKFINLIGIEMSDKTAPFFPQFNKAIYYKFSDYWDKENKDSEFIQNLYLQERILNTCGLLNMSIKKICRVDLGPLSRGDGRER